MNQRACRECHLISTGSICPNCKSSNLSDDWTGVVVIIDASNSQIAEKMGVKDSGKYAIRIR